MKRVNNSKLLFFNTLFLFYFLFCCSGNLFSINSCLIQAYTTQEFNTIPEDSSGCAVFLPDSLREMIRFDHTENNQDFYYIRLAGFHSEFERLTFYESAREQGFYIENKNEFHSDSALFRTSLEPDDLQAQFLRLFENTIQKNAAANDSLKRATVSSSTFYGLARSSGSDGSKEPFAGSIECSEAEVACSDNVYNFPAGTSGTAPPPVDGYPNYGCLSSYPCPAWFYMQVQTPGDIIIFIQQSDNHDVDFICWGPFTSLTAGCSNGLTGTCDVPMQPPCCSNPSPGCENFYPRGNIVDCSYSGQDTETCHILNAQVGEFYILLITNFSTQPGTITFSQTGGTGVTSCNIVVFCSMLAITTNVSSCNSGTNTFSVSGNIEFSNPPPTGILSITDNTAIPPVPKTSPPPFVSPLAYNLWNFP